MLVQKLLDVAERHANRPAFLCHDGTLTYQEFFSRVEAVRAQLLEQRAVGRELSLVGLNADRSSVNTYAAILAIWSIGSAYVPLSDDLPPDRLRRMIAQAGVEVVLSEQPWHAEVRPAYTLQLQTDRKGAEVWQHNQQAGDLAYLLFTSGSTGTPKGVPITFANLEAFAEMMLDGSVLNLGPEDRFLQMFELSFDLSVMCYLIPLLLGGSVCLVPRGKVYYMDVLKTLRDQRVTVGLMVPSVLTYVRRFVDRIDLPDLRYSLFCGEALLVDQLTAWRRCIPNAQVINLYGPTEATIFCMAAACDDEHLRSYNGMVEIGVPIGATTVGIVDGGWQPVEPLAQGELVLKGPQVMTGYWKDAEKTAKAFTPDGAYRTGDIAYRDEAGRIFYCGRLDSQVKVDGHRVELGEIEDAARTLMTVPAEAVASIYESDQGVTRIVLFLAGSLESDDAFAERIKSKLPEYMWPSAIIRVDQMPLNNNGKVDRKALVAENSSALPH